MAEAGYLTKEDLAEVLTQIRIILTDYKERGRNMLREDVIAYRDDLTILRVHLADIESDLFEQKLAAESTYDSKVMRQTDKLSIEYSGADGKKKESYPEDKAKRRAKISAEKEEQDMIIKKSIHRKAYQIVNTLQDVSNAMSSRIALLSMPSMAPTDPVKKESVYNDPWSGWKQEDPSIDKAMARIDNLERLDESESN